ncbi:hypothetical protein NSK_002865 [Nannochloropsis salina CCMP1776]|uniref:J domain-containing protein n=1 Tax=Nannochloropsis salina CCMP1776 TaxID=1027361 RepID=A0A4D9D993_9STRA|nr:hypothetical protein NSK_002865 [Nannochloropsis salina CCMP1776]|eukprot:TFJ86045.1 hypothetical protein NSK_002865 [Nannochloropsis salina CCMP1776]
MAANGKECYYSVLGLERPSLCEMPASLSSLTYCITLERSNPNRTASETDVKVAYRKLALKHHPDKNVGNEAATAIFQLIQEAHAVLSDARERSWYDSHRDEILRGEDEEEEDEPRGGRPRSGKGGKKRGSRYVVNVWPFFSASAFNGYGDRDEGFYAVYRRVFERVDAREREGAVATAQYPPSPGFGGPKTVWADVAAFYGYWGDFVSRLSFGWEDEYREQDAPSRQVRRAMEKENRKSREAGRKEYQEAVRALVEFVKRRDKRVMQRQVQGKREEAARIQAEAEEAKVKAEKFRREREIWLQEQTRLWEEEEVRRVEEGEEGRSASVRLADEESSGESEEEQAGAGGGRESRRWKPRKGKKKGGRKDVVYECVVCAKTFKSEKQLNNHKQSRAHRKMVETLQAEFGDLEGLEEEEEMEGEMEEGEGGRGWGRRREGQRAGPTREWRETGPGERGGGDPTWGRKRKTRTGLLMRELRLPSTLPM